MLRFSASGWDAGVTPDLERSAMDGTGRLWPRLGLLVFALFLVPGCVGVSAQLLHLIYGNKVAAQYEGLNDKKVAVVCVSDASAYGPNNLTYTIERLVAQRLAANVPGIKMIPQSTVDNWKDQYGWDENDFVQIGKGIGADRVVAIEIAGYTLHDGPTMYKGQAAVTSSVYDINNQTVAFHAGPEDYQFPKSGRPAMHITERQFEEAFLTKFCEYLARRFYEHEKVDTIAEDAGL
jgi:hypothetical protein